MFIRRFAARLGVALALLFFVSAVSSSARADDPAPVLSEPTVRFGWTGRHVGVKGIDVTQHALSVDPQVLLFGRLELSLGLQMTMTDADIKHQLDLPFDVHLHFPWQPTVNARAGVRVYDGDIYRLTLSGSFVQPIGESRAAISGFTPQGTLAAEEARLREQLAFLPQAANGFRVFEGLLPGNTPILYDWYELRLTAGNRWRFGPLAPRIDAGLLFTSQQLRIGIDPDISRLLDAEGVRIPSRLHATRILPYAMPGLELHLGSYVVAAEGLLIPTDGFTYWQAGLSLTVPVGLP